MSGVMAMLMKSAIGIAVKEATTLATQTAATSLQEGRFLITRRVKMLDGNHLVIRIAVSTHREKSREELADGGTPTIDG